MRRLAKKAFEKAGIESIPYRRRKLKKQLSKSERYNVIKAIVVRYQKKARGTKPVWDTDLYDENGLPK